MAADGRFARSPSCGRRRSKSSLGEGEMMDPVASLERGARRGVRRERLGGAMRRRLDEEPPPCRPAYRASRFQTLRANPQVRARRIGCCCLGREWALYRHHK